MRDETFKSVITKIRTRQTDYPRLMSKNQTQTIQRDYFLYECLTYQPFRVARKPPIRQSIAYSIFCTDSVFTEKHYSPHFKLSALEVGLNETKNHASSSVRLQLGTVVL